MFFIAITGSMLMALLAGGKISNLARTPIKQTNWLFMGFGIQVFLAVLGTHLQNPSWLIPVLHIGSYVALFRALLSNRHLPGMSLLSAGILMNFLVIAVNGGRMPVSEPALMGAGLDGQIEILRSGLRATHTLLTDGTKLGFLADVYYLNAPFFPPTCFSVGDVAMAVGLFALVFKVMVGKYGNSRIPRHATPAYPRRRAGRVRERALR